MTNPISWLLGALQGVNHRRLRKRREPARIAYQQWVAAHDTIDAQKRLLLEQQHAALAHRPLISVVMPVYNAPLPWLDEAIESVRRQVYTHWELCIADDNSSDPAVRPFLERKAQQEPRIKLVFRPANGHISAASNSAIEIASGEFMALMDQDDLIPEQALLAVAQCIGEHRDAGLIYSDEDMVDEHGNRESPARKTAWRPELLATVNRLSHLSTYRTSLVREVGGFRIGYEGAQDHDLALRCAERLRPEQIVHVPQILYHWRAHQNSTASHRSAKPYAIAAREKTLADHARRTAQR